MQKCRIYSSPDEGGEGDDEAPPIPALETFREAEILGLRLMQEGNHEQALEGMFLDYCSLGIAARLIIFTNISEYHHFYFFGL